MQNVKTVMVDFRMWDGRSEKGPWTRPDVAREDFWKEVMLSWTLKDELESDTKEKLVSCQYFPAFFRRRKYLLVLSEYFLPPFPHQFGVKHAFRRKEETLMTKWPLWLFWLLNGFSVSLVCWQEDIPKFCLMIWKKEPKALPPGYSLVIKGMLFSCPSPQSVLIDKETASRLKSVINTTLIVTSIPYIIMALGVFFGLIFTWLACRGQRSTDEVRSGWRNVCLTRLCSLRTSAMLHWRGVRGLMRVDSELWGWAQWFHGCVTAEPNEGQGKCVQRWRGDGIILFSVSDSLVGTRTPGSKDYIFEKKNVYNSWAPRLWCQSVQVQSPVLTLNSCVTLEIVPQLLHL